MSHVTIRVEKGPAQDFTVLLIEESGAQLRHVLAKADLTTGKWTVNLAEAAPAPPSDILTRVSNAQRTQRSHADYEEIARTLHSWLIPQGPVRNRWVALDQADTPPRLYVDVRVPALARLPWELARSAQPPLRFPALVNGLYRLEDPTGGGMRCSSWPFRILLVIGCSAAEEQALGVDDEVKKIERTFLPLGRSVDVHCLRRPDKNSLLSWIREFHPHVFHFAGHGGNEPGSDKFGLLFEYPKMPWTWCSEDIDNDLPAQRWAPQFVFLNACRSAVEQDGSWSVQRSFVGAGAKAVLGMQADTQGDLAGAFASELYRRLADGQGLETAVHGARRTLAALLPNNGHIDWRLPAVAMTERDLRLFKPRPPPPSPSFDRCSEFEEARYFANCRECRRQLTHWLYPAIDTESTRNVLLIHGERGSGKSHLLKWCMENWAIGGARVRYIELHDSKGKDFISVLRQIRDGEAQPGSAATCYLHAPLDPIAFRRFNWELNNITRTGEAGEWIEAAQPAGPLQDFFNPLLAKGEQPPHAMIGASFVAALNVAARSQPLILAFDNFPKPDAERLLPATEFEELVRHVFAQIARQRSSPVRLAFAVTPAQALEHKLALLPAENVMRHEMPVNFTNAELTKLAAEMVWFRDEAAVEQIAEPLLARPRQEFPRGLGLLGKIRATLQVWDPALLDQVARMR